MASKKKSKKKVTITIDVETLQTLLDAVGTLASPGWAFEMFVDDPDVARKLKKRAKKKRR
jgi:hypothetical protein